MSLAKVFMLTTSEPVSGSVIAKKPRWVPATHPGMYFCFCSTVPNLSTVSAGPRFCMLNGRRQDAETREICSASRTDSRNPIPLPPYSSGSAQEKNPSSPIFTTRSARNSWCFSSSATVGAISSFAKRRAVSCASRCSSVRSKNMMPSLGSDRRSLAPPYSITTSRSSSSTLSPFLTATSFTVPPRGA